MACSMGTRSTSPRAQSKAKFSAPAGKPSSRQARVSMPAPSSTTCLGAALELSLPLRASANLRSNHQVLTASRPACAPATVSCPVILSVLELGGNTALHDQNRTCGSHKVPLQAYHKSRTFYVTIDAQSEQSSPIVMGLRENALTTFQTTCKQCTDVVRVQHAATAPCACGPIAAAPPAAAQCPCHRPLAPARAARKRTP